MMEDSASLQNNKAPGGGGSEEADSEYPTTTSIALEDAVVNHKKDKNDDGASPSGVTDFSNDHDGDLTRSGGVADDPTTTMMPLAEAHLIFQAEVDVDPESLDKPPLVHARIVRGRPPTSFLIGGCGDCSDCYEGRIAGRGAILAASYYC